MSRSIWPQQSNLPQSSQDAYCRRSCTWVYKFALLHQAQCMSWILVHSPKWRIKPFNYLQQPFWEVLFPASSPLVWSAHRTSSRRRWTNSLRSVWGCIRIVDDITIHGCTEAEHDAHLHNLMQSQNVAAPLTPTPTPSHPWQMCATDIFKLEGFDHLVVGDFCSKMIFVRHIPPGQRHANKVVSLLKEMFSEQGIPKALCSDNGPQYLSAQFANFCISWGITHETSSPHYPQSNGLAKACIKSIKHALQWAKYSGADPHLALLALWATPIDTKLPSPAELLYQCRLRITIPAKICNSNPLAT